VTEHTIQNRLRDFLCYQRKHKFICPNYTPAKWWECDVFSVTEAGLMVEHEIKVTVADFRADAKKGLPQWKGSEKKHDRLAARDPLGPSRFYYATPEGLITAEDCPEWAGLVFISPTRVNPYEVKPAPILHREKVAPAVLDHVKGIFYWRYWNLRLKSKMEGAQP
jgi:hypothetical protein